jgi:hypothetical protein
VTSNIIRSCTAERGAAGSRQSVVVLYYLFCYTSAKYVLNYSLFDFFYSKFDHSSYLKFYVKYYFFLLWLALLTKNSSRIT